MESGLSKNQLISELCKSPHGKLEEYLPLGIPAAKQEPEFFSHLIAWNHENGQVRDAKVALPIIALCAPGIAGDKELEENSLAALASLDPRNFLRGLRFAQSVKPVGKQRTLRRLAESYIRAREASWPWWERSVLQHRTSMLSLYASWHVKPHPLAEKVLFEKQYVPGSLLHCVSQLGTMEPKMAAGEILRRRIPFLIAQGALGKKAKEPELLMALIEQMSPSELRNNVKMLEKLGVKNSPSLRSAFERGLTRVSGNISENLLKTQKAVASVEDEGMKAKLQAAQERQLSRAKGIEGDWLVAGDASPSMKASIEIARQVAAILARMVKGKVHLMFFDDAPRYFDATGKTLEEITEITRRVQAGGRGTNAGCVMDAARLKGLALNGVAIITDQSENARPVFAETYLRYVKAMDREPVVYCYWTAGQVSEVLTRNCEQAGIPVEVFDIRKGIDYYSLPNLIQTMNTKRWTLLDQILEFPLMQLSAAFTRKEAPNATA